LSPNSFAKALADDPSATPLNQLLIELKVIKRVLNGRQHLTPDVERFAAQVSWSILHGDMTEEAYGLPEKAINTAVGGFGNKKWGEPRGMRGLHPNWAPSPDLNIHMF